MTEKYGISIDLERDNRLTEQAYKLVTEFYLADDETSPQEAYARAAVAYSADDSDLAQRIYDYVSKGYFMFSSPIFSNAQKPKKKHKALPISCFLGYVPDRVNVLIDHHVDSA